MEQIPWENIGAVAAGSVAGVVVLLGAIRYLVLRNGKGDSVLTKVEVLQGRMSVAEDEIRRLRQRMHDIANAVTSVETVLRMRKKDR